MIKNIYNKLKKVLKENYISIIYFIFLYVFFMWPLDYYIITGGGIMPIGDRIIVDDSNKSKGSINLSYVSESKGTIATFLLSYIMPNWERDKVSDYTYDSNETKEDVEFRGIIELLESNDNAIKNAYTEAKKTYTVTENKLYVYYVSPKSKSNFKVGDEIISVEGKEINNAEEFQENIKNYNIDDEILIKIKRNNKEKDISTKFYEEKGRKIIGIYVSEIHKYKTYPKVKVQFKKGEYGPSGGLAETLDIYNKITKKDITKGMKLAVTGEIDRDGNILPIGGVEHKLLGAVKGKADLFIVPKKKNYKTCIKYAKKHNLKIKIIGVSTFKETLRKLDEFKK